MATKETNPKGSGSGTKAKPCPPGGHKLKPDHPATDEELKDRINRASGAGDEAKKFEAKAARHNQNGILRREGSLKRDPKSPGDRSAVSGGTKAEEVGLRCEVCGQRVDGELDHVTEEKDGSVNAVECKTGAFPGLDQDQIERNTRQMERLRNLSENGTGVMYKVPKGTDAGPILKLAKQVGLVITKIIPV